MNDACLSSRMTRDAGPMGLTRASLTHERHVVRLGSGLLSGGAVASEAGASAGRGGAVACVVGARCPAAGSAAAAR